MRWTFDPFVGRMSPGYRIIPWVRVAGVTGWMTGGPLSVSSCTGAVSLFESGSCSVSKETSLPCGWYPRRCMPWLPTRKALRPSTRMAMRAGYVRPCFWKRTPCASTHNTRCVCYLMLSATASIGSSQNVHITFLKKNCSRRVVRKLDPRGILLGIAFGVPLVFSFCTQ
jgi:hypothetical protein